MSEPEESHLTPMSSPVNDIRKIRTNGAASAAELMDWLAKMKVKSPRDVLGAVANSNLFKSVVQATVLVLVLIAVFTVLPWMLGDKRSEGVASGTGSGSIEAAGGDANTAGDRGESTSLDTGEGEGAVVAPTTDPEQMPEINLSGKEAVADKLGVGESKEAPANVNPLEASADDLLDGLE